MSRCCPRAGGSTDQGGLPNAGSWGQPHLKGIGQGQAMLEANKELNRGREVVPLCIFIPPSVSNRYELSNTPLSVHTCAHLLCRSDSLHPMDSARL